MTSYYQNYTAYSLPIIKHQYTGAIYLMMNYQTFDVCTYSTFPGYLICKILICVTEFIPIM